VTMSAPADPSSLQVVLVLEMSGVREAYWELSAAGLRFLAEPYSPPWGGHRCFVVDPDGYLIELEEPA
jgi:catechol 2,3-dioxygenase-like lactoylglutathione lyase family enzyme